MSDSNIVNVQVRDVQSAFEMLSANRRSALLQSVKVATCTGKMYQVNRAHRDDLASTLQTTTTRFGDTLFSEMDYSRRTALMVPYQDALRIDEEDDAALLADPSSILMEELYGAYHRTVEDRLIAAYLGNANTGEHGESTQDLATETSAGQQVVKTYGASDRLTLEKLKYTWTLFLRNNVDAVGMGLTLNGFTSSVGYNHLITESGLVSKDNVSMQVNQDPAYLQAMLISGFRIIPCERLSAYTGVSASSSDRPAIFASNRAVHLAYNIQPRLRVDQRPDKNYLKQVHIKASFGAVRVQGQEVFDVRYDESA